jgi:hypothetical protein
MKMDADKRYFVIVMGAVLALVVGGSRCLQ